MAMLEYRLQATGAADIGRVLASVENRFATHAKRINRTLAVGGGRIRQREQTPGQAVQSAQRTSRAIVTQEQQAQRVAAASQQRYETSSHKLKLKNIEREKREELNKIRATNRASVRERENVRRSFARGMGVGTAGGVSRLAAVGKTGAAMIGVGGSVLAASAVTEQLRLDEQIRRFSIAGRGKGEAGMDPEVVRRNINGIAMETGIAPEDVMRGVSKFQADTGSGSKALAYGRSISTFAQATGADPEEVAAAASSLFTNFKIEDLNQLNDALALLTMQGKKGSFEFRGMAGQLSRVTASFTGRGVGAEALPEVGAMMQVIKRGTGSDEVTTTAVDALFRQLISKSDEIQSGEAFGGRKVNVFKGGKATNGMRTDIGNLVADTLTASRGNVSQLQKIFGDEGMKGVGLFAGEFQRASGAAGGGDKGAEAGRAAVLGMIKEFSGVKGDMGEVQRDASDIMQAASIQFELATTELKQVLSAELLPVVRDLVPHMKELGPPLRDITQGLVSLGSAVAEHPFLGLGALMAASVASEIAKAQLATLITGSMGPAFTAASLSAMKFAGAAGLAAFGIYATYDQASAFGKENGGFDGFKGMLGIGTDGWGFEGIDEVMNRQARERAAQPGMTPAMFEGTAAVPTSTAAPATPSSKTGGGGGVRVEGGAELQGAAAALKQAAEALKASGGGGTVNRGNAPSPVKG